MLAQLQQQQQYLLQHLRLQLKVVGIGNSKKMFFNDDGIDLSAWQSQLEDGDAMDMSRFIENVRSKNLRNSVFADVTASSEVADTYDKLFEKSVSIVACNKVACSSPYVYYKKLKDLAREHNALFLFETNVGAGLPVIGTLMGASLMAVGFRPFSFSLTPVTKRKVGGGCSAAFFCSSCRLASACCCARNDCNCRHC